MRPTRPQFPISIRLPILALLACLLGVLAAMPASADIFIVDCPPAVPDYMTYFPTISEAVTAALGGGPDTIVVRPCTYPETIDIPMGASGLHIIAAEVEDTGLLGAGTSGVGSGWPGPRPIVDGSGDPYQPCIWVDAERVSIQGLELIQCGGSSGGWGILASSNSKLLKVHDTVIRSLLGPGIEVVGADAPSLTSNIIAQVFAYGIRLHGVTDALVADNQVSGNSLSGAAGILISGGSENVLVQRNDVQASQGPGIHVQDAYYPRILRNTAVGNCVSMPFPASPSCGCDQILSEGGTLDIDVAGNDSDDPGTGDDGISLCSMLPDEEENPGT